MALTRITKGVIKPNENYDTHNIVSTGIVTAVGLDINGNADVSGNLSVGGVLTYEDVTSIDSVGIITAQRGIHVGAGISVVGVGTFGSLDISGDIDVDGHTNLDNVSIAGVTTTTDDIIIGADNKKLKLGVGEELQLYQTGNHSIIQHHGSHYLSLRSNAFNVMDAAGSKSIFSGFLNSHSSMYYNGSYKIRTQNTGAEIVGTVVATGADINGDLDVDGHTNLDNVSIAGFTTITQDLDVDGHTNLDNVSVAGVITATSFIGDGSDLTNLPAGLGTALSATATSPLNKMYYTNQVLGVPSSVTVDVPASASKAYTQFADIKVESSADLIIAEGDDLIPDVLGLADFGTFGGGASAGRIRVNSISNAANDGSPTVQKGLVVTGVTTSTTFSGSGASLTNLPSAQLTGALPAIDGSNLTGISGVTINGNVDNRLVTATGTTGTLNGEVDLVWDGSRMGVLNQAPQNQYFNTLVVGNNSGGDKGITIRTNNTSKGVLAFSDTDSADFNRYDGYISYLHSDQSMRFHTSGANERFQIDSAGRFLKGLTGSGASRSSTSVRYPHFQLSSPWSSGLGSYKIECTDDYPIIFIDSNASYANGSGAGVITWSVKDSSGDYCNTASVLSKIDGTPSNDSAPGRLEFHTTTSGTTPSVKMTIDSVGRVTKPNTPFVMVHIQTTTNRNTTGSYIVVPWDIIHVRGTSSNTGSHFNTSNHRFTAPVDGRYLFVMSLNIVGDNIVKHRINGNDVSKAEYRDRNDAQWDHADASFIYDMNANDYYDCVSSLTTSGQRFNGGSNGFEGWDTLSIYLLG